MAYDDDGNVTDTPEFEIPHYHGDTTRLLFVIGAAVLIVAQSTGASLPLSTTGAVLSAVLLVVTAGITSPAHHAIHWLNALIAVIGVLLFGVTAIDHYRTGGSLFDSTFIYTEALALLSLAALYLTTRTIRWKVSRRTY